MVHKEFIIVIYILFNEANWPQYSNDKFHIISVMMVACWESIRQRYDIAFIGAASAIVFGLLFIFFTMVVSEWMFPNPYTKEEEIEEEVASQNDGNDANEEESDVVVDASGEGKGEEESSLSQENTSTDKNEDKRVE